MYAVKFSNLDNFTLAGCAVGCSSTGRQGGGLRILSLFSHCILDLYSLLRIPQLNLGWLKGQSQLISHHDPYPAVAEHFLRPIQVARTSV